MLRKEGCWSLVGSWDNWRLPILWTKRTPDTYQLEKLAQIIVVNFGYLSVDELQLFFFYFCSARYRHFYNTFDPSIVILSLRDFLRDRNRAFEEREQREREREREEWKKNAITHEEYLRRKERDTLWISSDNGLAHATFLAVGVA